MSKLFLPLGTFALAALLLPGGAVAQQYAHEPFFEQTVAESRALGLETIGDKLLLAATLPAPLDHGITNQLKDMSGADLARFLGTLQSKDRKLAASLSKALDAIADAAGAGKDVVAAIKAAQPLLAKAHDTVLGKTLGDDPAFKAGVMVNLLLADNGVSEGYEDAVEDHDASAYADGWAALQRVKQLWAELKPLGTVQRQADGQEMVDALDKLYPSPTPPGSMAGANGDDAEDPAQRLSGIMEEVANSSLYPDRDLPRLAGHLADVTGVACTDFARGRDKIGVENLYAANDHFSSHISGTASLVAPELEKKVSALLGKLIGTRDDDDDKGDAAKSGKDDDDDDSSFVVPASPAKACGELKHAFIELKTALSS